MMDVKDLGEFNDPLLICGGAYGNLEALEAMLAEAAQRHIPAHRIIHSGDAIAYCADGVAVAARLAASGIHCLQGNVEQQLAQGADDCGCGFETGAACDVLSMAWYNHARRTLPDHLRSWMGGLPSHLRFRLGGKTFLVVHGGVRRINRFIFASHKEDRFEEELAETECDAVIGGHCGLPFTRLIGSRLWHNSGALGMPANDGTSRVWFSVLSPHDDGLLISHHPLQPRHDITAAKMARAGLPEAYGKALGSGLWPSLDILPETEKAATGQMLHSRSYLWRADGRFEVIEQDEKRYV